MMSGHRLQRRVWFHRIASIGLASLIAGGAWTAVRGGDEPASSIDDLKALQQELSELQQNQAEILKELQTLKKSLDAEESNSKSAANTDVPQAKNAKPVPTVDISGLVSVGRADAPVVVLAFSGYECSHCANFARQTEPEIKRKFVATGKVQYYFCDFVFDSQKNGRIAARAAHCAADQGKFWEMHDLLFSTNGKVSVLKFEDYAQKLNLDLMGFRQCLQYGMHEDTIDAAVAKGKELGVTGTPTFFIGRRNGKANEVEIVRSLRGSVSADALEKAINAVLPSEDR